MPTAAIDPRPARPRRERERARAEPAEDRFLADLVAGGQIVEICLIRGNRLEGRIVSFDRHAVRLEGEETAHLYKTAISMIREIRRKPLAKVPADRDTTDGALASGPKPHPAPVIIVKKTRRAPAR